ncbi:CRISPR-associated protein Cas5 [Campylobacter sp. RM16187]|uniref:CRISPR-associated protein Cas5 n=1 Tax=Campylobacter sp. RM16187 TaxID=1660063 RepID=UPI0021B69A22|nr:CRISPR-associated protein Cas5 [Campylobacter sp. RM16187]QKG30215.1 CRISPR/Cas system-associated RAMP protein Cas5, type I-B/HMARI [Campylobacter sp. RM16187]
MFAFKVWGKFACFKDPLGISQNITLPIPPKTAVSGMLAALLGVEDYLNNSKFSGFKYSVVLGNSITKKTFSQNYINDYTKNTKTHINNLLKFNIEKIANGLRDIKAPQKPINRELLINPGYIIFIDEFELEAEAIHNLKNRICKFSFYLGNSEFAGNFEFLEINKFDNLYFDEVSIDSFLLESDIKNIDFEDGVLYSPLSFATALDADRSPIASKNLILSNNKIRAKNIEAFKITCGDKIYHCRFV